MDLFSGNRASQASQPGRVPLAERCRPQTLEEFIGQQEVIGPESILRREIAKNQLRSTIFWGPPGVGKTTLARLLAREIEAEFIALSAVTSGVKDVRQAIEKAGKNRRHFSRNTILFIDEIHRFNKAQQDALLHAVEDGTVVLIGATTENPSFEIISPLLSRCQVYTLKPLSDEEIKAVVGNALSKDPVLKDKRIDVQAWKTLYQLAGGDARRALNVVERAVEIKSESAEPFVLDYETLQKAAIQKVLNYDKSAEYHYDLISAFIKSVRGSDPDAAIFWMARMLEAGEDALFIARRMVILASEDIGNADPHALTLAVSAFTAARYIGLPEAKIILSQVAAYLAAAPKSNAAIKAINAAIEAVHNFGDAPVPLELRNAATSLLKDLGYGKEYQYAHNAPGHFVKTHYLPEPLRKTIFYQPTESGREAAIGKRLRSLWQGIKNYGKTENPSKNRK